jgi:hypothetical protein
MVPAGEDDRLAVHAPPSESGKLSRKRRKFKRVRDGNRTNVAYYYNKEPLKST